MVDFCGVVLDSSDRFLATKGFLLRLPIRQSFQNQASRLAVQHVSVHARNLSLTALFHFGFFSHLGAVVTLQRKLRFY